MPMSRSLLTSIFGRERVDTSSSRGLDTYFGQGIDPEDLLNAEYTFRPVRKVRVRQTSKDESSDFHVCMDVGCFDFDELNVTTKDNSVFIEGKHGEKPDQSGFIAREFTKRYALPEGVDSETLMATLSSDGILTVKAVKKPSGNERIVPITVLETSTESPDNKPNEEQEEQSKD